MIKNLLLLGALLAPCTMFAADYFITPEGAGNKDGSTWGNAMGLTEYYDHMKFYFGQTKVDDAHTGEQYFFSTGKYSFNETIFISSSGVTFKGGYDPTTGEQAKSGRTVFDGNSQARANGAIFVWDHTEETDDNVMNRAVRIQDIDFENFITESEWRNDNTNWQSGRPSAIYIQFCGHVEIIGCNFKNNICRGTGDNAMAGALSLNKVNCLVRNCSFTGNEGTDGGAIKVYYNVAGNWTKMSKCTIDRCYFTGNKTSNRGGAIYGLNLQMINVINSTMTGNHASQGGAIYKNTSTDYPNIANLVSCTLAGNTSTDGEQIYTNGNGVLNVANSIIVADGDANAIADESSTSGYTFQGNNLIGKVPGEYISAESDNISADNTYRTVFGDNTIAADGTLTPGKYWSGMAPDAIAAIVTNEAWPFTVDAAVDQLGNARSTSTSNGALALPHTVTGGIELVADPEAENGDEAWYNLQGMRMAERPVATGIYIHKGRKVLVR